MADIEGLIDELTLDEKASLTAGEDLWSTVAIERLSIPKIRVTDGPNGARGASLPGDGTNTSVCVPCGSALGATWDVDLLRRVGVLLGQETRRRGCRVLLAPTVNIHRSPLAGRNFECYSEDPLHSGALASAFVQGVQSQGVSTTVKHYVGNDAEFERMSMSSVIDERTLREIYLVPFEMAVRDGGSLGVMTSYNRVNGTWCGESPELFDILRDEWGFEGFVLSDWYAATSTESARAGMDLEMPGPARAFGPRLAEAVRAGNSMKPRSTPRCAGSSPCSIGSVHSARSRPTSRHPLTCPRIAHWRARRRRAPSCCCRTEARFRSTAPRCAALR